MQNIQNKINNCTLCGNFLKLTKDSVQIGKSKILIVGENPAKNGWIESGKAFYSSKGKLQASGRVLEKLLQILNLTLNDINFTEMCKCLIDDRKNLLVYSKNCFPFLIEQLQFLDIKIILTMGSFTTQMFLNQKIKKFCDYVGKTFELTFNNKNYLLIPIYHPSPLNPKGYKDNLPIFEKLKTLV